MTSVTTTPGPAQTPAAGYTVAQLNAEYGPGGMPNQDLSFSQVLSMLNPLQYIPLVGSVYRAVTGDTIPPAAQVLSGALLGGPLGLVASAADAILQQATGQDVGDRIVAMFVPDSKTPGATPPATQDAANTTPQAGAASGTGISASGTGGSTAGGSGTDGSSASGASTGATPPASTTSASAASSLMPTAPQPSATTVASTATPPAPKPAGPPSPAAAASAGVNAAAASTGPIAAPPVSPPMTVTRAPTPAGGKSATGWTLADYRMFAGHGMPPSSGSNGMEFHNNPVPLQTSIPLPGEVSHTPVVPNMTPATATPAAATAPTTNPTTSSNTTPAPQAQGTWVSQAMMHGLDRYRQMMIQQEQQQDQTLSTAPTTTPAAVPVAGPLAPSEQR